MEAIRKYLLPVAAGATLLFGLTAVAPGSASAKKTSGPSLKISPKSVTASNSPSTFTVKGKGFPPNATDIDVVECQVGTFAESSCDVSTTVPVSVNKKGSFTLTYSKFVTNTYSDSSHDSCQPATRPIKNCGIAAGNLTMTEVAGPYAVKIKP